MAKVDSTGSENEEAAPVLSVVPWVRTLRRARQADDAFERATSEGGDSDQRVELERRIREATPLEAYYAVKRRGLADAVLALDVMTPAQIQTLFDLELWKSDRLEAADLLAWLEGFRVAGQDALVRAAKSLDPEALAVFLRRRLFIALTPDEERSDEEPVPDWVRLPPDGVEPIVQTPDGRFLIAARVRDESVELDEDVLSLDIEEEERKQALGLVQELYLDQDWEYIASVLRLAQSDLTSFLEEEAYRFRSGRLEDLGFAPSEKALEVYAPLDLKEVRSASAALVSPPVDARLPRLHAESLSGGLLERSLSSLGIKDAKRIEADLLALSNLVLAADRVDAGDLSSIEEVLIRTRGYLNVALGYDEDSTPISDEEASRRLKDVHVSVLFRVGFGVTLRQGRRARKLLEHPGFFGLGVAAVSPVERTALEALLLKRPLFSPALSSFSGAAFPEDRRLTEEGAENVRPFGGAEEVQGAERWLASLLALAEGLSQLKDLSVDESIEALPAEPLERDIDVRLTTASANALLGRGWGAVPLTPADLVELADRTALSDEAGRFGGVDELAATLTPSIQGPPRAELEVRVRSCLARLAQVLFPLLGQEEIDPRFVEGVLRSP